MGLRVETTFRPTPQRRALTFTDAAGERTITVIGERLGPRGDDPLPWDLLEGADAVYLTAGDDAAVRLARRARVLVATTRVLGQLAGAGVALDALVGSRRDAAERYQPGDLTPVPGLAVWTEGKAAVDRRVAVGCPGLRRWRDRRRRAAGRGGASNAGVDIRHPRPAHGGPRPPQGGEPPAGRGVQVPGSFQPDLIPPVANGGRH